LRSSIRSRARLSRSSLLAGLRLRWPRDAASSPSTCWCAFSVAAPAELRQGTCFGLEALVDALRAEFGDALRDPAQTALLWYYRSVVESERF